MTAKDFVTILVPVMVALISGLYAYLQTRKSSSVEGGKLNLSGYESLNRSQAAEIDRLRADRLEDQERSSARISELERRLNQVTSDCETVKDRFSDLMSWARQVTRIFNDPNISRILAANDVHLHPGADNYSGSDSSFNSKPSPRHPDGGVIKGQQADDGHESYKASNGQPANIERHVHNHVPLSITGEDVQMCSTRSVYGCPW
jgi:hypothetical protein